MFSCLLLLLINLLYACLSVVGHHQTSVDRMRLFAFFRFTAFDSPSSLTLLNFVADEIFAGDCFVVDSVMFIAARAGFADGEAVADSENLRGLILRFLFCAPIICCRLLVVDSFSVEMDTFFVVLTTCCAHDFCADVTDD